MEIRRRRTSLALPQDELSTQPLDRVGADDFYESYEPKGDLGKGLSSVVRRCVHRETGKEYAVKFIDKTIDITLAKAVRTEIDALERVSHQYIIKLHEWYQSPVYFFLVFELAAHGELFDQLNKAVRFSEMRSRMVMKQLLLAIEHIHSLNIVHRDVKPENILLGENFNVRLSDFGFAAVIPNDTSLRELCGTPGYMAPEVLKCATYPDAQGYGRPVDMWACGVILYTMLVGFPPFWHRKQMLMLRLIMDGKYSFAAPEWHDIGDSAKDMIRKLLVVDPNRRYTVHQALAHPFILEGAVDAIVAAKVLNRAVYNRSRASSAETPDHLTPSSHHSAAGSGGDADVGCDSMVSSRAGSPTSDDCDDMEIPTVDTAPEVPYEHALIRSAIDGLAFRVYGHWVKKGDQQNRAAMFENQPKNVAQRVRSRMTGGVMATPRQSARASPTPGSVATGRPAISPLPHM
ncbi:phosphorylase b kinase gamma catalytic chain, skeletal muscle/heart isoform-like isoform X2 [Sycon ciliatum]|uniref:phosphorylase b kinase gamma catalytic chain, skeletal muscle/heart isoform-like isoform X2 n=1 Tax=Sycon ciliatum TaxID=27933 RepID=UPI0031F630CA